MCQRAEVVSDSFRHIYKKSCLKTITSFFAHLTQLG